MVSIDVVWRVSVDLISMASRGYFGRLKPDQSDVSRMLEENTKSEEKCSWHLKSQVRKIVVHRRIICLALVFFFFVISTLRFVSADLFTGLYWTALADLLTGLGAIVSVALLMIGGWRWAFRAYIVPFCCCLVGLIALSQEHPGANIEMTQFRLERQDDLTTLSLGRAIEIETPTGSTMRLAEQFVTDRACDPNASSEKVDLASKAYSTVYLGPIGSLALRWFEEVHNQPIADRCAEAFTKLYEMQPGLFLSQPTNEMWNRSKGAR